MGDMSGDFFARWALVKAIAWLAKYDRIPKAVIQYTEVKRVEALKIRSKMIKEYNER